MTAAHDATRRTAGHAMVVFGGNAAAAALSFAANILLMRVMGPAQWGIVAVATVFMNVLWQFVGRGFDQALVRCVAQFKTTDPDSVDGVYHTVHQIKLAIGVLLVLAGLITAPYMSRVFVGAGISPAPMLVAAGAGLAASLWGFTGAALQAERAFVKFAIVQVANAAVRFIAVAILLKLNLATPTFVLAATGVGFLGAAVVGYAFAPSAARHVFGNAVHHRRIFQYARWLVVSSVIHLLYVRIDLLLVGNLLGPTDAGLYGTAATFIQLLDLVTLSLLTVVLPSTCTETDPGALKRQIRTSLRVSVVLAILMLPGIFLAGPIMTRLLTSEYQPSVLVFQIIFFGAVATLITHPLQAVIHARGRTQWLTVLDVALLVVNGFCNYLAIRWYGMTGAAVVALLTRLAGGAVLTGLVAYELRRPMAIAAGGVTPEPQQTSRDANGD